MLKSGLVVGASAVAVLGVAAWVGVPMAHEWVAQRQEQESSYSTGREAKADLASVPAWLPDAATRIRFKMRTTDGDRLLVAHLPDGRPPADCVPTRGPQPPGLTASWFPQGVVHKGKLRCGEFWGYTEDATLYAWQRGN